jgi:hypothetical protein
MEIHEIIDSCYIGADNQWLNHKRLVYLYHALWLLLECAQNLARAHYLPLTPLPQHYNNHYPDLWGEYLDNRANEIIHTHYIYPPNIFHAAGESIISQAVGQLHPTTNEDIAIGNIPIGYMNEQNQFIYDPEGAADMQQQRNQVQYH